MESTISSKAVGELVENCTRYTHQLLFGCGDSDCRGVVCYSGRRNISTRPVRRHKPRTARAAALNQAQQARPGAQFCEQNDLSDDETHVLRDEGPRDPSSMIQQLCDTKSVRQLTAKTTTVKLKPKLQELYRRHAILLDLSKSAGRASACPNEDFVDNVDLVNGLMQASISWLIDQLPPLTRAAPWIMINRDIISKGLACPQKNESRPCDDSYNPWVAILDTLNCRPYLRLLQKAMSVVGRRSHLEEVLRRLAPQYELYQDTVSHPIGHLLASSLFGVVNAKDVDSSQLVIFAFVIWTKRLFATQWDSRPNFTPGGAIHGILELMRHLNALSVPLKRSLYLHVDAFEMPLINAQVDTLTMARSYMDWEMDDLGEHHVMEWPMLFSMKQLALYFRTMCHLKMRRGHSGTEAAAMLRGRAGVHIEDDDLSQQLRFLEQHYLLLSVSRDEILEDTWTQLWQRRRTELSRPLRVRLGEASELEIGHDLGGVQIEFFNLVCREVFAEQTHMFTTDAQNGISYFRAGSLQPLYMFELFGLIVALALYNGITLPVRLPRTLYTILVRLDSYTCLDIVKTLQLQDLDDRWAHEVKSMRSILDNDIDGLEYSFPFEANGLRMSVQYPGKRFRDGNHEMQVFDMTLIDGGRPAVPHQDPSSFEWPGWRLSSVSGQAEDVEDGYKARYVQDYISHLLYDSVAPQLEAFLKGFHNSGLVPRKFLRIFQPHQLKAHLEGSDHLDIDDLKAATKYDGYEAKSKYIQMFWRVVSAWPEKKQKLLLKFVTAAERIPITGASQLTFVIKKAAGESQDALPTSSTCFGTLMLPRYPSAEVLASKLSLALAYGSEGFGTG